MRAFFGALWRGLDGLRKFLHLLLLLALFGFIAGALRTTLPHLPNGAALVIRPEGALVEQLSGDPLERAFAEARGIGRSETLVWDVVDTIDAARDDDRIRAIVLDLGSMTGAGQPTMQEITRALVDFRTSGKKVVAYGTGFLQGQYLLAAHADEIYLDPLGFVLLDGYERYRMFYKDALEKLGIEMNVFRVGAYKSAVEPYIRSDMSPEDREESLAYLSSLWTSYQEAVVEARGLEPDAIDRYASTLSARMVGASGDGAQVALDAGLVTGIRTSLEVEERLMELVGVDEDADTYRQISQRDYLRVVRAEEQLRVGKPVVGVVVASGEMLDGNQPSGTIGGDSTARLIREARLDDNVRALVLRIDSPGGSVLAAERIHREIEAFKAAGKPLIVSMGDLAASGGYYIAAPADEIWASPATITGSIGIFAVIPTFGRTLDKLGVEVDGVGTTRWAGQLRIDQPLGPDATRFLRSTIERGYDTFLRRVAEGRGRTLEEVDAVAQGRVWAGLDARRLGLVDELGTFEQAIESAARHGELEEGEYAVEFIEPSLSWAQELALQVKTWGVRTFLDLDAGQGDLLRLVSRFDPLEEELARWQRLTSGHSMLAYCLCAPERVPALVP